MSSDLCADLARRAADAGRLSMQVQTTSSTAGANDDDEEYSDEEDDDLDESFVLPAYNNTKTRRSSISAAVSSVSEIDCKLLAELPD